MVEISRRDFLELIGAAFLTAVFEACAPSASSAPTKTPESSATPTEVPPTSTRTPEPTLTPEPTPEKYLAPQVIWRGNISRPFIYLTIDDCFDPKAVEAALDIARNTGLKLTFFPIGRILGQSPRLWQRAITEGHDIENHTQTHRRLSPLSSAEIRWDIVTQCQTLRVILGDPNYQQHFLRPPGGDGIFSNNYDPRIPQIAQELGLKVVMWSDDSETIQKNIRPGAIVLQHAISSDITLLPGIIAEAKRHSLQPISLEEGIR